MRVLVTRPRAQAESTARRLEGLGHAAVVAPLLTVVATGEPPPPGLFAGLVVTSANAVPMLAGFDKELPVLAVGERTATLLREAGFTAVTAAADATTLAGLVLRSARPGARLLHVVGRDHKPEPQDSLEVAGFAVETWIAYAAVAEKKLPQEAVAALSTGTLGAALHYSRRTAATAVALTRAAGLQESFLGLGHLCLSEDVATPLREQGALRLIVADRPNEASLFATLALLTQDKAPAGRRSPGRPQGC